MTFLKCGCILLKFGPPVKNKTTVWSHPPNITKLSLSRFSQKWNSKSGLTRSALCLVVPCDPLEGSDFRPLEPPASGDGSPSLCTVLGAAFYLSAGSDAAWCESLFFTQTVKDFSRSPFNRRKSRRPPGAPGWWGCLLRPSAARGWAVSFQTSFELIFPPNAVWRQPELTWTGLQARPRENKILCWGLNTGATVESSHPA